MSALTSWPEQALRTALVRHGGPALASARAEARRRGWVDLECTNPRCRRYTLAAIPDDDSRELACPRCFVGRLASFSLTYVVDEVLDDHNEPELGMTAEDAEQLAEAIIAEDLHDDRALQAHDLLHQRATFGRAW